MSEPESFPTLQSIVLHEVQNNVAQVRNSATEALLWLGRGLKFLKEFLSEVNKGQEDIQGALSKALLVLHFFSIFTFTAFPVMVVIVIYLLSDNAYGKTLRQYHGWVVRGVFAVSVYHLYHCLISC